MFPSHRILILDDEPTIRDSLTAFLEDFGYETVSAPCAEDAEKILGNESFSLGIIDLRLPGISGDIFIQKIHHQHPMMRFLIHTGSVEFTLSAELGECGVDPSHIFIKPLKNLNLLLDAVKILLKGAGDA